MRLSQIKQQAEQVPPDSSSCETGIREMTQLGALEIAELLERFADRYFGDPGLISLFAVARCTSTEICFVPKSCLPKQ